MFDPTVINRSCYSVVGDIASGVTSILQGNVTSCFNGENFEAHLNIPSKFYSSIARATRQKCGD